MKKLFVLLLMVCLALCFAACKQPTEQPDPTETTGGKVETYETAFLEATAVTYDCKTGYYYGTMRVKLTCAEAGEYVLSSEFSDAATVSLKAGENTVTVPCQFLPLRLQSTRVNVSLTKKDSGEVVEAQCALKASYEALGLTLTQPGFRGNFYPGQDYSKVTGSVPTDKDITLKLEGPGITTQEIKPNKDGTFSFATPNFEVGEATLTATIDGCTITQTIRRLAETGHTMTWIEDGHLVVNGEPVLARNVYAPRYRVSIVDLEKYDADNLYETKAAVGKDIKPWAAYPDLKGGGVGEYYQDVYPSQKVFDWIDEKIASLKNTDFGYWELCDEPGKASTYYLKQLYEYIAEKDPYHVIQVNTHYPDKWIDCCDMVSTHPYTCPRNTEDGRIHDETTIDKMGAYIDRFNDLNRADKCISFSTTCYANSPGLNGLTDWDYPTFDEFICNSWAALNHGADKLYPYAGHDLHDRAALYEGVRYVFSSVDALEDFLLYGKRTILMHTDKVEVVMWELGDKKMFTLLNFTLETQTVTVDNLTGTWYNFRHDGMITGNTFELRPCETVIGTSELRGADLPTYEEVADLVNTQEAERLQNESLWFGYNTYTDIIKTNSGSCTGHKLFDGVLTNHAWSVSGSSVQYLELRVSASTEKSAINRIVVHGLNLADMELKIEINQEMITPEFVEVIREENSVTYILEETISLEALRLEFNGKKGKTIQLYEIEVFNDVE